MDDRLVLRNKHFEVNLWSLWSFTGEGRGGGPENYNGPERIPETR